MGRRALIVLCLGFMTLWMASCGQTYKLQSITVSPVGYNVATPGNGPLAVTANYSNTKTADVTAKSSYEVLASALMNTTAPQNAVTVNNSGIVTISGAILACTWSGSTPEPYQVQASYTENGVTATALVPITVSTMPGCSGTQSSEQSTAALAVQ